MSGFQHPLEQEYPSEREPWVVPDEEVIFGSRSILPGICGLYTLALQGRWQELAARCAQAGIKTGTETGAPLELLTFHVMALMKLKVFQEAFVQLQTARLLEPHEAAWPFALRWLQADLETPLGRPEESINRFYKLLDACSESLTRRRRVTFALVAKLSHVKRYKAALTLLNNILRDNPRDALAWSQAARVQLMLGDYRAAKRSIEQGRAAVEWQYNQDQLPNEGNTDADSAPRSDETTLALLTGNYSEALQHSHEATPQSNGVSSHGSAEVVQAAVGQAYSTGDLSGARRTLEMAFLERPFALLTEPAVSMMSVLYAVVPPPMLAGGSDAQRRMGAWVAAVAPDDFDLSCCKSGSTLMAWT